MSDCVGKSDGAQSTSSWCSTEEERNLRWSEDFALILISLIISSASLSSRLRGNCSASRDLSTNLIHEQEGRGVGLVWSARTRGVGGAALGIS